MDQQIYQYGKSAIAALKTSKLYIKLDIKFRDAGLSYFFALPYHQYINLKGYQIVNSAEYSSVPTA